ncbi:MAG: AtpZ/AtpI family protein [Deltaproteobacteria bacterium]|nr:AtpZ/AtpI family protein [Deltaproteobacteria bacterium]
MKAEEKRQFHAEYGQILMMSAWGMAIVIASFLFLYLGYLLDKWLNTPPTFMFGLFFLALVTSIGKLYQEAWRRKKEV